MKNDSQPPLPQPNRFTCASCGFGWDKARALCPRCGTAHTEQAKPDAPPIVMVVYGCGALFLGTFGVLPVLLIWSSHSALVPNWVADVWLGLFLFCIWKFFRGGN
jgi:uncharacterized protein (DUF983 family)